MEQRQQDQQPDTSLIESEFSKIKNSTYCPFAVNSKIEYFDDWDQEKTFDENILVLAKKLESFADRCESEKLDGLVFEISGALCPKTVEDLAKALKDILLKLNKLDPKKSDCMDKDISANSWQFAFNGQRMFIITFTPFYSEKNPRYSMSANSAFIFLQPESSFDLHIANPTESPQTIKLKENIRRAFEEGDKPYDSNIVDNPSDAIKYVKPLNTGDAPIEWWK